MLSKPADQIGADDIQELIDSQVPEGQEIEYKETLPTEHGSPDRWVTQGDRIGRIAKEKILEESVAFANAYGGALLLGIAESDTKPPTAARVTPIPRCTDLAERLKLVFRDGADPQLPSLEIFAVQTAGDDGVVIIRVRKSRMAPHRVAPTLECTVRRSDRCERMGMREIQDMTLNTSRGLERLERRLERRSERFAEEFNCLDTPEQAYGIRVTAVSVGDEIQYDRVYREHNLCQNLYEPWRFIAIKSGASTTRLQFPTMVNVWRPRLRAARNEYAQGTSRVDLHMYREIHCDGLVEIGLTNCRVFDYGMQSGPRIYASWPIVLFSNLLVWADRVRNGALLPMAEYAVDAELYIRGDGVNVDVYGDHSLFVPNSSADSMSSSIRYPGELLGGPRYSLGERNEITDLIGIFYRDFWNSIGQDVGDSELNFVIEGWP